MSVRLKHDKSYQCKYISHILIAKLGTNVKNIDIFGSAIVIMFGEKKMRSQMVYERYSRHQYNHGTTDSCMGFSYSNLPPPRVLIKSLTNYYNVGRIPCYLDHNSNPTHANRTIIAL